MRKNSAKAAEGAAVLCVQCRRNTADHLILATLPTNLSPVLTALCPICVEQIPAAERMKEKNGKPVVAFHLGTIKPYRGGTISFNLDLFLFYCTKKVAKKHLPGLFS